ncbi:hypothetical protein AB0C06_31325 [Micromonospora inaquosa]|uniref:Uncharacterized protein n=1 Tax=Micromonospora inaquosa TaxID=2203716 RepID=A0A3N9WTF4_9ACTN|nr:hypothetical protein [Micromonospora inaquosa]RQX04148.1 hypothetical protein DLJ59_10550 [Micromonospora inaquosa]
MVPVTEPHWIIHLPTTLHRVDDAAALAMALRHSLGHVLAIDFGETTLSEEDRQFLHTRVWCDRRLPGGARCALPTDHPGGSCAAGPSQP